VCQFLFLAITAQTRDEFCIGAWQQDAHSRATMTNLPCAVSSEALDEMMSRPPARVIESLRAVEGDVAVLGASGKMGFQLCRMLRRAFDESGRTNRVVAVSRFSAQGSREKFEVAGLDVVAVDLSDEGALAGLPEWSTIFYLAGVKFGTSGESGILQKMNVDMPRAVARRFRNADIVALSTGCVYSFVTPETGGSTEDSETNPVGEYAQSCLGREQAFVSAAREYRTRSALIRLNYAIDLRYGVLLDIAQKVRDGQAVDVTMGHVNVIWQPDALAHTILALEHVAAPPFVINVTGTEILEVRELAEGFAKRFGKEDSLKITGEEAGEAWLNNASKAYELLGEPVISTETMMDWIAGWLQAGGETLGKPTKFEVKDGKY
jgi:nucleoside-diphosphate-sugar epimerase